MIVGPSGVGKSSLINALRSNPRVSDTADGENWFEPVGFCLFCPGFLSFNICYCVYESLIFVFLLYMYYFSDFR